MVCKADWDTLDPYRLPPPPPDKWNLPFVRPDVPLVNPWGNQPMQVGVEYLTTPTGNDIVTGSDEPIIVGYAPSGDLVWPEPESNPAFPVKT
jgi:hypothetical protein